MLNIAKSLMYLLNMQWDDSDNYFEEIEGEDDDYPDRNSNIENR